MKNIPVYNKKSLLIQQAQDLNLFIIYYLPRHLPPIFCTSSL